MKKIGILTFSFGSNYGGTLQCIGLYKVLTKLRFDIKVIDYIPKNVYSFRYKYIAGTELSKRNIKNNIVNIIPITKKLLIKFRCVNNILNKFNLFRKNNMSFTNSDSNIKRIIDNNNFNYIVVGSDQVWSETSGFFLNEINNKYIKKISYAACSGTEFYKKEDKEYLAEALLKFKNISVRNEHTKKFVESLIGVSPEIVCDPSVLYDYKEFLKPNLKKEKYILTYILGNDIKEGNEKVIKKIKEIYGELKVVAIGIPFALSGGLHFYNWADEILYDASPEDWLNLMNNAEFIYTDSYHGALFSMKFHKQFLAYYAEKNRAPRFMDLAKRYGIEKNIVNTLEEALEKKSISEKIDYKNIDILIEQHRKYSMDFLKKALED